MEEKYRFFYSQNASNEEVPGEVEASKNMIRNIGKRLLEFLSHILRKDGMESLCITGFIDRVRRRGRWANGQVPEQNLTLLKLLATARDRRECKTTIT